MKKPINELKTYFNTGDQPTEEQFANLIDSFLHKDSGVAVVGYVENENSIIITFSDQQTLTIPIGVTGITISDVTGLTSILDSLLEFQQDLVLTDNNFTNQYKQDITDIKLFFENLNYDGEIRVILIESEEITGFGLTGADILITKNLSIQKGEFVRLAWRVYNDSGETSFSYKETLYGIPSGEYLAGEWLINPNDFIVMDIVPLFQFQQDLSNKADLIGGKIIASQMPASIDDVLDGEYISPTVFNDLDGIPYDPMSNAIYIDTTTNITYRWSGSAYIAIGNQLALGETSSTAYAGNKGKIAYDHSQLIGANPHTTNLQQITTAGSTTTVNTGFGGAPISTYMLSVYDAPGGGGFGSFRAISGASVYLQMRAGVGLECSNLQPIGAQQFNLKGNTNTWLYNGNPNTGHLMIGNPAPQTSALVSNKTFITFQDMIQPFTGTGSMNWNLIRIASTINLANQSGASVVRVIHFDPTISNIASNQHIRFFEGTAGSFHINTLAPENSAVLQADSKTQGSIPFPRMTEAERMDILSPAVSLHVYQTNNTEGVYVYKSTGWQFAY